MRFVSVLSVLILLGVCAVTAQADKYDPNEKPWSYDQMSYRTDYQEQEPNNTCPGPQQLRCGDRILCGVLDVSSDDDYYQVYLTAGSLVTIGLEGCNGSDFDTYLELYDPSCGSRVAYDDDSGPNMFSLISNYVPPSDGWYNIKVFSYGHYYTGSYNLFTSCGGVNPPDPNDTCNPDYQIACGTGVLNGDMSWDTNNYDPLSGGCATGYPEAGKDVAYRMDLPQNAVVNMTYYTPNFDAAFYIVGDCNNVAGTCFVGADAGYDTEYITNWTVPAAGTYWLILDHYGTDTGAGPWTLNYDIDCNVEPTGACCVDGRCTITTQTDCGGQWLGPDYPTCNPNPCPSPVRPETWGSIKANYR